MLAMFDAVFAHDRADPTDDAGPVLVAHHEHTPLGKASTGMSLMRTMRGLFAEP